MAILGNPMLMGAADPATNFTITTSETTTDFNLRTELDAEGFNNDISSTITYTLEAAVTIGASSDDNPAWQTGTIGDNHTLTIHIRGVILGEGGAGGAQTSSSSSGCVTPNNGADGSDAMFFSDVSCPDVSMDFYSTTTIKGAGGGGGSGGSAWKEQEEDTYQAFGGAGGRGEGYGGSAASGSGGENDPPITGGTGGTGGAFGAAGSAGSSGTDGSCTAGTGGASGYAVRKNGNTVTITDGGATIVGTVG